MPFLHAVQASSFTNQDKQQLIRELDFLRSELDNMRAKFTSLLAKLDADVGVTDVDYASTQALSASVFTQK